MNKYKDKKSELLISFWTKKRDQMTQYLIHQTKRLAYTDQGNGIPIVLLHGFCLDKSIWAEFQKPLVLDGYRVICVDLPGFGESSLVDEMSIDSMAGLVKKVVDHVIPQTPCVLIGHSMGGYVTLAFADKYPNCLLGIGLFHSHPYEDSNIRKTNRQKSIAIIQKIGVKRFVGHLIPGLFNENYRREHPSIIEQVNQIGGQQSTEAITGAQLAMKNRQNTEHVLEKLRVPALFIIGKQDNTLPYQEALQQTFIAQTSVILFLENISHMGMYEAPQATQEAIAEFIAFSKQQTSSVEP